jgi:hypothetical protein
MTMFVDALLDYWPVYFLVFAAFYALGRYS